MIEDSSFSRYLLKSLIYLQLYAARMQKRKVTKKQKAFFKNQVLSMFMIIIIFFCSLFNGFLKFVFVCWHFFHWFIDIAYLRNSIFYVSIYQTTIERSKDTTYFQFKRLYDTILLSLIGRGETRKLLLVKNRPRFDFKDERLLLHHFHCRSKLALGNPLYKKSSKTINWSFSHLEVFSFLLHLSTYQLESQTKFKPRFSKPLIFRVDLKNRNWVLRY